MTVRDRIRRIQRDFIAVKPVASTARDYLIELTALSGNVSDEVRESEAAYREVLADALSAEGKANRAKMRAERTPEFSRYREAKDTMELVKQLIISTRTYVRSVDEESRLAR